MSLRIAFCGASGTGKTTLARQVAERFGLPLSPSMARRAAAAAGLKSPYDADSIPGARQALQRAIVHRRIAWQGDNAEGGFVSDRTSFDDLAYSLMHDVTGQAYQELVDAVLLQWRLLAPTYHRVILCPLASFWRHGGDPARVDDLAYHKRFETLLLELLQKAGVPVDLSLCRVSDVGRADWLRFQFGVLPASPAP